MKLQELFSQNWSSALIVLLVSSFIGFTIVRIVDGRMSNISINMPRVHVPQPKVTVKLDSSLQGLNIKPFKQSGGSAEEPVKLVIPYTQSINPLNTGTALGSGAGADYVKVCPSNLPPKRDHYERDDYHSEPVAMPRPKGVPSDSADHQSRPAQYPQEAEVSTDLADTLSSGKTYYKDPADMTPAQRVKFRNKAKFTNMTVKDYKNWLQLFKNTPEKLAGFHRGNLRILTHGGHLMESDMPRVTPEPHKADHEYMEKINQGVIDNIPQPEYLGYQAHNFEEEIGSSLKANRNLRHLDYMNPDEPLKTWILTRSDHKKHTGVEENAHNLAHAEAEHQPLEETVRH